jgi:hypothetical protein
VPSNVGHMAGERSLDEIYDAYRKEVASGAENLPVATRIAFEYRVAKVQEHVARTQEKWARVSAGIAAASVRVAIAAVIVAAVR